jgi:phage FluMu protein Com
MVEVRCRDCGKLLFKAASTATGRVEVVCPDRRCRRIQTKQLQDGDP